MVKKLQYLSEYIVLVLCLLVDKKVLSLFFFYFCNRYLYPMYWALFFFLRRIKAANADWYENISFKIGIEDFNDSNNKMEVFKNL